MVAPMQVVVTDQGIPMVLITCFMIDQIMLALLQLLEELVFYFFGNGDLVAYDFDGNKKWERNLQKDYGDFCFQWTFSASPTFYEGELYLPILQRDEPVHGRGKQGTKSFLLCRTLIVGETIWKHTRPFRCSKGIS